MVNVYVLGCDGGVLLLYLDNNESGDNCWVDLYKCDDIKGMVKFYNGV